MSNEIFHNLYFVLRRAKLHRKIFSQLMDVPDIHRFPTVQMVKMHFLLENL